MTYEQHQALGAMAGWARCHECLRLVPPERMTDFNRTYDTCKVLDCYDKAAVTDEVWLEWATGRRKFKDGYYPRLAKTRWARARNRTRARRLSRRRR
jgi:hypothetical protein